MPPPLSTLGVFHTFATVIAIYLAFDCYLSQGRIDLKSRSGKVYFVLTSFGCISTLWLVARSGHYCPGHALGLMIMALLAVSLLLEKSLEKFKATQAVMLTTSFLFSLIPAVMETLTRLPLNSPFANGPEDSIVKASMATLFAAYFATVVWQIKKFKSRN